MPPKKTAPKKKPAAIPFLARAWAWLGVAALAAGGIYAIILVGARSPKVQNLLPFSEFFYTSLIVHVNLTVLVWMLSMTSMLWSFYATAPWKMLRTAAFLTAATGTLLMAISPFTGEGHPLLNNYVPILAQPVFLIGLSLFGCGILLQVTIALADNFPRQYSEPVTFGLKCVAIVTALSLLCFGLSSIGLKASGLKPQDYYDHLFWAGGHTLQIAYTLICLCAWLMLAQGVGLKLRTGDNWLRLFLALSVLITIINPLIYGAWPTLSAEHQIFFTEQMKWGGGISAILIGTALVYALAKAKMPTASPARNALISSLLLFMVGGSIGHLISGANVVVPAHYHGSIVGVSLAMMGILYLKLPLLGGRAIDGRFVRLQPYLYGGGQLLHIAGLAWSGGYGTLRKTPGAAQSIEGQTAMGLMGFGGLLSIIGGLLFVVFIWRGLKKGV